MPQKFVPKEPVNLEPPKNTPFTLQELSQYDGKKNPKIYVAIKGTVFDVSNNKQSYGDNGAYHIFAGKDASKGLGMSSLKPEDAVADISSLTKDEIGVLNDWYTFFLNRYNIVGKVVDIPNN